MISGVVVITTAQLYSTSPELKVCSSSNPTCSMPKICDDGTMVPTKNEAKCLSSGNHSAKTIHHQRYRRVFEPSKQKIKNTGIILCKFLSFFFKSSNISISSKTFIYRFLPKTLSFSRYLS